MNLPLQQLLLSLKLLVFDFLDVNTRVLLLDDLVQASFSVDGSRLSLHIQELVRNLLGLFFNYLEQVTVADLLHLQVF